MSILENLIGDEKNWARELSKGLVSIPQLKSAAFSGMPDCPPETLKAIQENFDIRIPVAFVPGMSLGDETLAKQVLPSPEELVFLPEELEDPIGDEAHTPVEGITHRYSDRALLKVTYQCAVYCRFCFRRYKVSDTEHNIDENKLDKALQYVESHPEIWEVILTGGDPLTLTNSKLAKMIERMSQIPHVKVIRFHTRIPTALPSRIDAGLLEIFQKAPQAIWIVAHVNASSEITPEAEAAFQKLSHAGISVLSQSVLLKGVNDTFDKLKELFRKLVLCHVKPYYLHYPDLAQGTNHFRVSLTEALALVTSLRGRISGICIPQLVVDIPGGLGKITVDPQLSKQLSEITWEFTSPLSGEKRIVTYPK
jgi:lysine 2,3-aminomutase